MTALDYDGCDKIYGAAYDGNGNYAVDNNDSGEDDEHNDADDNNGNDDNYANDNDYANGNDDMMETVSEPESVVNLLQ